MGVLFFIGIKKGNHANYLELWTGIFLLRDEYDREIDNDTDEEKEVVTTDLCRSEQLEDETDTGDAYFNQQCLEEDNYCFL